MIFMSNIFLLEREMGILLTRPAIRRGSFVAGRPRLKQCRSGRLRFPSSQKKSGRWESNPHNQLGRLVFYH